MKKLIILLLMFSSQSFAQNRFQITAGGSLNDEIWAPAFYTSDGGYIMAGDDKQGSNGQWFIAKISANGSLQWTSTFGGSNDDQARAIVQTSDGKFVAAGWADSYSGSGNRDILIVKLDTNGSILWSKTMGGITSSDEALSITQTSDSGFAISGFINTSGNADVLIARFNASGTLLWNKLIGGSGTDWAWDIIQTSDGGFAATGFTNSFGSGGNDIYVIKLDSSGSLIWNRTIGGSGNDQSLSIIQTSDGGFAIAGYTTSYGSGGNDVYIAKLNSSGTLLWTRTAGDAIDNRGNSIIQLTGGGFAVSGSSFTSPNYNGYILKLDSLGTVQLSKATLFGSFINPTFDGGFALNGTTNLYGSGLSDFCIEKLDANWNACGNSASPSFNYSSGGTTTIPSPTITTPGLIFTPLTITAGTYGTRTVVCTITGIQPGSYETPGNYELFQNYPNPFNPVTKIKFDIAQHTPFPLSRGELTTLKIYDILGKEITTLVNEQLQLGTYEVAFDGSNLPSGIYFYKLTTENFTDTKRMILIK